MHEQNILFDFLEIKLEKFFNFLSRHFFISTLFYFLIALAIRVILTPNTILRHDAFLYFVKALEITKGNLSPMLSHASGWPLVAALFLSFFEGATLFQKMFYVKILSVFLDALTIFPLAYIARDLIKKENVYVPLFLFIFYSQLVISASSALSESLFMFLLTISLLCAYKSLKNPNYLLLAAFFAAFSFYVRHNGVFVMLIILSISILLKKNTPKLNYKHIIVSLSVFIILSAPFLYQRYIHFGSPMFYGENSKYFMSSYTRDVWSPNIAVPSLKDYLVTHTVSDYFNKFIKNGFYKFFLSYYFTISTPILFLFVFGFLLFFKKKIFLPLTMVFVIWALALIPVWEVYGLPRHLYPTIPFIILFTSAALEALFKNSNYKYLGQTIFIVLFAIVSFFSLIPWYKSVNLKTNFNDWFSETLWADWVARNVRGKLAMQGGAEWVMSNILQRNMEVSGLSLYEYSAPQIGLSVVLPGYFNNLASALKWWKEAGITHVAVDNLYAERRPYLKEIDSETSSCFKEVFSNFESITNWKIKIYRIDWSSCGKSLSASKK